MYTRLRGTCGLEAERISVLKFGSSVLDGAGGYQNAAEEVRRELGEGRRVVAVVSAMGRTTDQLLSAARALSDRPADALYAQLLSTGEDASAALLGIALTSAGVNTQVLSVREVALRTEGPLDDASPVDLAGDRLSESLCAHDVVVVPGFVGRDRSGALALLGRGGSDLTALFLAHRLGADEVRLLKDVDGVFPEDPKRAGHMRPLSAASFRTVSRIGNGVVQDKAIRFAEATRLCFRVAALGGSGTLVGVEGDR